MLVSEDEKGTSDTYNVFLKDEGHDVIFTADGQECIDVYKEEMQKNPDKQIFDIVVLDYRIPKKNGGEVAKEILAMNPYQKILIATAYSRKVVNQSGLKFEEKNLRLVHKPFEFEDMMKVISEMVSD
jgi:two-component system cell cycle response regulator CpdR